MVRVKSVKSEREHWAEVSWGQPLTLVSQWGFHRDPSWDRFYFHKISMICPIFARMLMSSYMQMIVIFTSMKNPDEAARIAPTHWQSWLSESSLLLNTKKQCVYIFLNNHPISPNQTLKFFWEEKNYRLSFKLNIWVFYWTLPCSLKIMSKLSQKLLKTISIILDKIDHHWLKVLPWCVYTLIFSRLSYCITSQSLTGNIIL